MQLALGFRDQNCLCQKVSDYFKNEEPNSLLSILKLTENQSPLSFFELFQGRPPLYLCFRAFICLVLLVDGLASLPFYICRVFLLEVFKRIFFHFCGFFIRI